MEQRGPATATGHVVFVVDGYTHKHAAYPYAERVDLW